MPVIKLQTKINAPLEICFDLSRSIDLHKISTAKTNETAIEGKTTGLISYREYVTWKAKHFGFQQKLTTAITAYDRPFHFCDEQVKGIFKKIKHDHYFVLSDGQTLMTDHFLFEAPLGILGTIFNKLILVKYLKTFLEERNRVIKEYAETGKWVEVID